MSSLSRMRRAPWLGGALLLALLAGLIAPLAAVFGLRYWPFYVGLAGAVLLLLGWLERLWQSRSVPNPYRVAERKPGRTRFRVVPGGKGNGHDRDEPEDDDGDKPRWLM
jgi:protein-S-isoprenylcysteine O-methyltransferase Ste14